MNRRLTMLAAFSALLLVGCGARVAPPADEAMRAVAQVAPVALHSSATPPPPAPPATSQQRRTKRVVEKDPDGDGIADYRVFVTETFDADGLLVERVREEDFEADGIIDDRTVTTLAN